MQRALDLYFTSITRARPPVWDCPRFALGALAAAHPAVGEWMLSRWPRYGNYVEGQEEFLRRGITDSETFARAVVEFSEGRMERIKDDTPPPIGALAFACNSVLDGQAFPCLGLVAHPPDVVGVNEAVFLRLQGGVKRVPLTDVDEFVKVRGK